MYIEIKMIQKKLFVIIRCFCPMWCVCSREKDLVDRFVGEVEIVVEIVVVVLVVVELVVVLVIAIVLLINNIVVFSIVVKIE